MVDAFGIIAALAAWSPWTPFALAIQQAPRLPGVYLARQTATGPLVYVGMAGERRGKGIKDRLTVYYRGKAAVSDSARQPSTAPSPTSSGYVSEWLR